jgi:succinyl-CoA synthetase beta subunit
MLSETFTRYSADLRWLTGWQYGVGVPKGEVAHSAEEAEAVAKSIGIYEPLTDKLDHGLLRQTV